MLSKDVTQNVIDLSNFEALKFSKSWYESQNASRISNILEVHAVFCVLEKKDPTAFFGLYSNHLLDYTKVWGKPAFTYRSEYNWKAWVLALSETENLILLSAEGGGSTFEVTGPNVCGHQGSLSEVATTNLLNILWTIQEKFGNIIKKQVEDSIDKNKSLDGDAPSP